MEERKTKLSKLGMAISTNRIKIVRGYSYVSAVGIPFLVAREIERMLPIFIPWWIIFIVAVIGIWVVGHIDFHRLWKNELEYNLVKNPEWVRRTRGMIQEELKSKDKDVRKKVS